MEGNATEWSWPRLRPGSTKHVLRYPKQGQDCLDCSAGLHIQSISLHHVPLVQVVCTVDGIAQLTNNHADLEYHVKHL